MDKYEIMLYPKAFRDIDDVYAYIAFEKLSPENAKGQTDRIWDVNRTRRCAETWWDVLNNIQTSNK